MKWKLSLTAVLLVNIHTTGCIGGLLSVSVALASNFFSTPKDSVLLMSMTQPEDFICVSYSVAPQDTQELTTAQNEDTGCGSSSCLERSHQERKQTTLMLDVPNISFPIGLPSPAFHQEQMRAAELKLGRPPPLFAMASVHTSSTVKRE